MSIFHLGSTTLALSSAALRLPLRIPTHLGPETGIGPGCLPARPLRTGTRNLVDGPQWIRMAILRGNGATPTDSRTEMTCTIVPGTVRGNTSATPVSRIVTLRRPRGKRAKSASAGARTHLPPTYLLQRGPMSSDRSAPGSQTRTPTKGHTRGTTAPQPGTTPQARTRAYVPAAPVQVRSAGARRATICVHRSSALEMTRSLHQAPGLYTILLRTATSRVMPHPHACAHPRRPQAERTTRPQGTTRAPAVRGTMSTRGIGSRDIMRGAIRRGGCHLHGRRRRRRMGGRMEGTTGVTPFPRAGDCTVCVCACSFGSALVTGS